jgi:hypothetical protein
MVWGVVSIGRGNVSGEASFEIKDSLTIYEAARVASGQHPVPRFLDGADINAFWNVLSAGYDRRDWHRVRPQRSVGVFHALMIEQGKIKPIRLAYLAKPSIWAKGNIDWRFTRIKTMDVARLCIENGWQPKLLRWPAGARRLDALVTKKRSQPKRGPAKRLLQKMFPDGLPSKDELPDQALLAKCKGAEWDDFSPDTVARAAADLRDEQERQAATELPTD